jgi:hypothetical protein
MKACLTGRLAVAVALVAAAAGAADLLLLDYFGPFIVLPYSLGTFAGVGLIIALRRPRHPIGWLLLAAGAGFALNYTSRAYAWRALVDAPGTLPWGEVALWLATAGAPLGSAAFGIAAFLFPTGRLLSRRWAPVLVAGIALAVAQTAAWAFAPRPIKLPYALSAPPSPEGFDLLPTIPNPASISGPAGDVLAALLPAINATVAPLFLLLLLAIVLRFVRSSGIERLQLKWFVYAASLTIGFLMVAATSRGTLSGVAFVLSQVLLGLVPVAIGVAIFRYRLYDIDALINRTLVYGALTATLAAAYVGAIALFQVALRPFTEQSQLAVAASTLIVAALFQPLRTGIQRAVDRRFYRRKYDAAKTLETFGARLRSEVDLEALKADVVAAARETVQPCHASLWLREVGR